MLICLMIVNVNFDHFCYSDTISFLHCEVALSPLCN